MTLDRAREIQRGYEKVEQIRNYLRFAADQKTIKGKLTVLWGNLHPEVPDEHAKAAYDAFMLSLNRKANDLERELKAIPG